MELSTRTIEDISIIRLDGGTQLRDELDMARVREFMSLYADNVGLDPLLAVEDDEKRIWLVDGFHRHAALSELKYSARVEVRKGTLEFARFLAAHANARHGLPRTDGHKRRAILLAHATPNGRAMGVTELALHCGVSKGYASKVLSGEAVESFPGKHYENRNVLPPPPPPLSPRAGPREVLHARIDGLLRADSGRKDKSIADEVSCNQQTVAARRKALGLPASKRGVQKATNLPKSPKPKQLVDVAIQIIREDKERTPSEVVSLMSERLKWPEEKRFTPAERRARKKLGPAFARSDKGRDPSRERRRSDQKPSNVFELPIKHTGATGEFKRVLELLSELTAPQLREVERCADALAFFKEKGVWRQQ